MKNNIAKGVLLLAATLLVVVLSFPRSNVAAQEIVSGNLFENPGFEAGYFVQGGVSEITVPNGWRMHWLDGVAFDGSDGVLAARPETVVWNIQDAPDFERPLFFRDGSYTLKIFKGGWPMVAALSQDVSGLEVGRNYRLSAPVFVDIVESYNGGTKVPPARADSGFVRFSVGAAGSLWRSSALTYSPTWTAENVAPFYQATQTYIWDFTATAESMTIYLEMGSRHAYSNTGFFMDAVSLFALGSTSPVSGGGGGSVAQSGPTATPFPTPTPRPDGAIIHTVNTGDSFWSIAIQYAPALGLTPEETLPVIRELNNNAAFISVGQELIIKEPGDVVIAPEPTAETAPEEVASDETSEEVIEVEGSDSTELETQPESQVAEPVVTEAMATTGTICVAAFDDQNADGARDDATENLQSDAAITIFRGGSTVSTYITDGSSEPYCFENLAPDTYQVQIFPPANFVPTTSPSWAVSVAEGAQISVAFGTRFDDSPETAVAVNTSAEIDTTTSDPADEADATPAEDGGFFSSIGGIVLAVAAVLVLLAGVGVVMLRRG